MKTVIALWGRPLRAVWMAAAVTMALSPVGVGAQELKIAYVDADRVLRDSKAAQAAQAKLEGEFSKREKELNELGRKLKVATDKLDKESPGLPEAERIRRQRELVDQDRDFQRRMREFQEDLAQRKNEELAQVLERANKVMKQIFDTEKYDLILQEAVFVNPRIDITEKVIKALNAGAK